MLTHALFDVPLWWLIPSLLVALAVDHWLGEPPVRWHPVVWMGNYLGWAGKHLQALAKPWDDTAKQATDWRAFWAGALAWFVGVVLVLVVSLAALLWLKQWGWDALGAQGPQSANSMGSVASWLAVLLMGVLLKPMLAWSMLRGEVLAVEAALSGENTLGTSGLGSHGGSLEAGRERLSWLVSRDVSNLSEAGVRESAIESLAENLSDSVVAPIFWFLLLGLPGAAIYRLANTADAMWGYRGTYRGKTWEWAGKWAARADDVLNWIPARLTGVALWLAPLPKRQKAARGRVVGLGHLATEAAHTPSPNSGWPMAAMALVLGVSLRKPGVYVLNAAGLVPELQTTHEAVAVAARALAIFVALGILVTAGVIAL